MRRLGFVAVYGPAVRPTHPGTLRNVDDRWPERLHIVTGKGGTGKTTVAAAPALALAGAGCRTLLAEVEGRQGVAPLFNLGHLPYAERRIATTSRGGEVHAIAVDPEEALLEYLDTFYKLGLAGRALQRFGATDFATTIAPGVRDVLVTGKVKEATSRRRGGRRVYDAVILDAPPTGRIGRFLNVNAETAKLAKVGPIKTQSEGVNAVLRSPMTAVHIVTLLEEMPVQETTDAMAELAALGIPVGRIIVNATRPRLLDGHRVTAAELKRGLVAAGLPADKATVSGLAGEARDYLVRQELEASLRADLADLGRPLIELPLLPHGVDRAGLNELADALRARPDTL